MNQQEYKKELLSRKKEIEEQISRKREILQIPASEATDELSAYDQHPGDLASDTFEREKEIGLLEMLEFQLQKLDDALSDYENGSYGICEQCGKEIEMARLERLINTTLCASCAGNQTDKLGRPAEEDVVSSKAFKTQFNIAGYNYDH